MKTDKNVLAKEWLIKSERDLIAARILAEYNTPIFDYAIFHCQQAAEKAIKAFLVYKGEDIPKGPEGHKLAKLIEIASAHETEIKSRIDYRNTLTRFAVDPRYPEYGLGNDEGFTEAFKNAESFLEYIKSILPAEARSAKNLQSEDLITTEGDDLLDGESG